MAKANRHPRERERLRALHSFRVLDTAPEALFDELVALAKELLDVPIALVSLVDEHRQWFKARTGFEACQTSLEESFCAHAILDEELSIVTDATRDARFADNPLVQSAGAGKAVRFYAGAPLITVDGLPLGTFCVLDVRPRRFGERKRRQLVLLRDQAMALLERHRLQIESARRVERMEEFLAHVSHEIRTPLSAVIGYAELLSGALEGADDRMAVDTILRNGDHLQLVVDDLLDLARVEADRLEVNEGPCAIGELLSDIDALMRHQALEKGIEWRVEGTAAVPLQIRTDALRLRQILINLAGNALKFTDVGEIVLTVALSPRSAAELEFTVRDTGIGMNAEQLARAFTRFAQADEDTSARFGGSGLGLTISHELARLLGGELVADSEPGVGSVFRLRVPCIPIGDERRVPGERVAPASCRRGDVTRAAPALCARRVLVIDDHEDVRHLAERMLERAGAEVLGVESGRRGLERLRAAAEGRIESFDALVLDMQMPLLDGFGVLKSLRREGIELPVVALTADAQVGQRERCVAAGCRAYVSKPFSAAGLVDAVAGVLDRSESTVPSAAAGSGPHLLLVDDSRDLTDALGRLLERSGYRVDAAASGREALALLEETVPDCIVLDHELHDMRSPALLAALRERDAFERTRFLSLSGRLPGAAERRTHGFDAYLQKPARLNTLLATLRKLLDGRAR